ncbi:MAG: S8 family serine peptidase [candidate division Zixibacteria bacterium]|nr:S8 family serine peptidase [candidate division Zixibacteria bacterium]
MFTSLKTTTFFLTLLITVGPANIPARAGTDIPALKKQPVIYSQSEQIISDKTRQYLSTDSDQKVKIWVFFTDKQVFTQADFDRRAATVTIGEKTLARRSKVGRAEVVFADLPVVDKYLEEITALGAELRRRSRWLNAASFDVPYDRLNRIASLPFVKAIKPVAGFKKDYEVSIKFDLPESQGTLSATALNYGSSFGQLDQINVPEAHNQGYTGKSVTLAVFDTGFRKSHEAFAAHYAQGRVLAEWDFIFNDGNTANEAVDWSSQWEHGTGTWAVAGGHKDGQLYGPAYEANFLLAKTEDVRSEMPVEEDNWIAALEWADSLGADVVTSSLGYTDWYTYADMDGQTALITLAANLADGLGIVVCNSMGNEGPGTGTLITPADAFNILAVGAVYNSGGIASFSSRGPTYDGRTKPEVCAQGVNTYWAASSSDAGYGYANGTSLSCPLVAGAVCVLIQAHPDFTPEMIRTALMETASKAGSPDNTYGWGIIDLEAALDWGANFTADVTIGEPPLTVNFSDLSTLTTPTWYWTFGDGVTSDEQNPVHEYQNPGAYDVSLTIETAYGPLTNTRLSYIVALADTLKAGDTIGPLNTTLEVAVTAVNNIPLHRLQIPIEYGGPLNLKYEGHIIEGCRTAAFEDIGYINYDANNKRFTINMEAGSAPELEPGDGPVLKLKFKIQSIDSAATTNLLAMDGYSSYEARFYGEVMDYQPELQAGSISYGGCCAGLTGNVDCSATEEPDISDITRLIDYLYISHASLCCPEEADTDGNGGEPDISDITAIINYLYVSQVPLAACQ